MRDNILTAQHRRRCRHQYRENFQYSMARRNVILDINIDCQQCF